jgi:hypothetical protein
MNTGPISKWSEGVILIQMQANPDNDWIQIESIRLVVFEFEARRATIGGIQISEGRRLDGFKIPLFVPRI